MSTRHPDRPRVWPLRLLEISPLIVFAIAVAVWFTMVPSMRRVALETALPSTQFLGVSPELMAVQALDSQVQQQTNRQDVNLPDVASQLAGAADGATQRVMAAPWRLYDASGRMKPFALARADEAFTSLAAYEQQTGARIAAFALAPLERPAIVYSAVKTLDGLTTRERAEYEASGTVEQLRRRGRFGVAAAENWNTSPTSSRSTATLPVDVEAIGSPQTSVIDSRTVAYRTFVSGGHVYEIYSAYRSHGNFEDYQAVPELGDTNAIDSADNRRRITQLAKLTGGAVFVVGPTDRLVAQRSPLGMKDDVTAGSLASAVTTASLTSDGGVNRTSASMERLAGTGPWTASVLSPAAGMPATSPTGQTAARAPMLYVAFWKTDPQVPLVWDVLGRTPWRVVQVWLAAKAGFVFGGLAALFLASLVAAPFAFARERMLTDEFELERERERVRREARERVIDRLTGLSTRIDEAATLSERDDNGLTEAARDIDHTIAELRAILGELEAREAGHGV